MAEWSDPQDLKQTIGTAFRSADFNAAMDNLTVLGNLTTITKEVLTTGSRSSSSYGPLDDAVGPEVDFETGHDGMVDFTCQVQGLVTPNGSNGYATYEVRNASGTVVVSPQDWRAARWRNNLTESESFTHAEQLDPFTEYSIRMVYRTDATIQVLGRYLQVRHVLPVV